MTSFIILLLMIILILPMAVWQGFALVQLWRWFVEPLTGVALTSIFHAAGLMVIVRFVLATNKHRDNPEEGAWKRFSSGLGFSILVPAFALGFGWLFHLLAF